MGLPVKISIGMPVFNGEEYVADAIESILNQSFHDFELIISDNCSEDDTGAICQHYASKDSRIRYVRQLMNIGAEANFNYVFSEASADYFMWAAVDDIRTENFLEVNYHFLEAHPDFCSSTSVATLANLKKNNNMGCWELDQPRLVSRLLTFYSSWHANSLFYGVHRRGVIATWRGMQPSFVPFLGGDWDLMVHMLSHGKMHCDRLASIQLGATGSCRVTNLYVQYRRNFIDDFLPFRYNSLQAIKLFLLSKDWTFFEAVKLSSQLWRYNYLGFKHRKKIEIYDKTFNEVATKLLAKNIKHLVICGAGEIGTRLAAILLEHNIKVIAFTDKMADGTQVKIRGNKIPVYTLEQACQLNYQDYIIASAQYSAQITQEILNLTENCSVDINIHYLDK